MVSFKNNFLIICETVLTTLSVGAKDKSSFVFINGDMALTLGNVMLTDASDKVTKVD